MEIIEELFRSGAPEVTSASLEHTIRSLPRVRAKFSDANCSFNLSHPVDFLSQVLEDFNSGLCLDLPFQAVAEIAFTMDYLFQEGDLIPDSLPEIGYADDAALCNSVLCRHHEILKIYAVERGFLWERLLVM